MSSGKEDKAGETLCGSWGRCQLDLALKVGGGLALGALGSLMLFRMAKWPLIFGPGLGLGLAYVNCEQDINKTLAAAMEEPKDKEQDKENENKG